jgi:hypothetical protein
MNLKNEAGGIYIVPTWKDIDFVLRSEIIPKVEKENLTRLSY